MILLKRISMGIFLFVLLFQLSGCSIFRTLENASRLKFKLGKVHTVKICGVLIDGKRSFSDLITNDLFALTMNFAEGKFPITFFLNVEARNPNDGTGGYARTDASVTSFPYTLYINGKKVLEGNTNKPFAIPGTGESITIPLSVEFDLIKSFENKSIQELFGIALLLLTPDTPPSDLRIEASPEIEILGTSFSFTQTITIDTKSFRE